MEWELTRISNSEILGLLSHLIDFNLHGVVSLRDSLSHISTGEGHYKGGQLGAYKAGTSGCL